MQMSKPVTRYGIWEWFGEQFSSMTPERRQELAKAALQKADPPICPFQAGNVVCGKKGGVCSTRTYGKSGGRVGEPSGEPVIMCPKRFDQDDIILEVLAGIVGFDKSDAFIAKEVPFMRSSTTNKAAGLIDLVLADGVDGHRWLGLEIQAVYFSGEGMTSEFERLLHDDGDAPPYPDRIRRPDWRSSGAKRLMPQLQTKVPMLRQWGTKMAVAVDTGFFDAIGGISDNPSQDIDDGDIVWLVVCMNEDRMLKVQHWEVLRLEPTVEKLLAAERIKRNEFEKILRNKLMPLDRAKRLQ